MVFPINSAKNALPTPIEELMSSLRSHEIELEQDEPQKKVNSITLKCVRGSEKYKALQAEEFEDFEDSN